MTNFYEDKVNETYLKIRKEEELALRQRRNNISKICPEIFMIEKEIGKLSLSLSMNALKNDKNTGEIINHIREKITDLRVQKTELLVSHGFPISYLEMHYRCPKCKDTGFILNQKCSCYKANLIKIYYEKSDLSDMISSNNFKTFNMEYFSTQKYGSDSENPRRKMEKNVYKAKDFISNFQNSNENLLFYGSPGTGKTFLSHCVAKELLDLGYFVVYRTAEELIQNFRQIRFNSNSELEDIIVDCDLLIIDDLGTEQENDFSRTELFNLINRKLIKNKKMLVSTNLLLEDLWKNYSDRLVSRLMGNFTICKFIGEDIRIKINFSRQK